MKTLRTKAWDVSTKTSDNKPKRIGRISKTSPPVQRMPGWARLDARFESITSVWRHPSHVTDLRNLLSRFAQWDARIELIMRYSPSSIAIRSKKSSNGSIAFSDCECPPAPLK